jgi:hypothetical protein
MHLEWFGWSLLLLLIWGIVRRLLKSSEIKKEMLVVSAWTSLLGLTEPLFVPAYWNPPSLFDLAQNTGFDIESFIFCFAIGGLGYSLYMAFFPVGHEPQMPRDERIDARHKYHLPLLLTTPALFTILFAGTGLNPIYDAVIAMMTGGILTWYCRPDLKRKMVVSAVLFLCLYFLYFLTLISAAPGYVQRVWNLGAISGILILGVPLEELMFAFAFGFYWSTLYEHFTWKEVPAHYIPGY